LAGSNIEVLSNAGSEHPRQVIRMRADESGTISSNFVGDKAAAGHRSVLSSQFSVLS
jgi:hypothetical protein